MNETRSALDEDRLRRLVRELDAVVRRELPWYAGNEQDPGVALLDLLAFVGDTLATYEARIADEGHLQHPHTLGGSRVAVTIDGSPWREVPAPPHRCARRRRVPQGRWRGSGRCRHPLAAGATVRPRGARQLGAHQFRAAEAVVARLPQPFVRPRARSSDTTLNPSCPSSIT